MALVNINPAPKKRKAETSYARVAKATKAGQARASYTAAARGRLARAPAVQPELKFHDIDWDEAGADLSAGVISNTSSVVLIGQGVTESTRIGRKAVIKNIAWRGRLNLGNLSISTITMPEITRLILVLDSQANGAAPTVSGADGLLETANYQSFNNLANKGRFKVLMDKYIVLNALAAAGNGTTNDIGGVSKTFAFYSKCEIPIEYSGTASPSVITEVRTNNIFGIMINESTQSNVSLDSKFRFRFTD